MPFLITNIYNSNIYTKIFDEDRLYMSGKECFCKINKQVYAVTNNNTDQM